MKINQMVKNKADQNKGTPWIIALHLEEGVEFFGFVTEKERKEFQKALLIERPDTVMYTTYDKTLEHG